MLGQQGEKIRGSRRISPRPHICDDHNTPRATTPVAPPSAATPGTPRSSAVKKIIASASPTSVHQSLLTSVEDLGLGMSLNKTTLPLIDPSCQSSRVLRMDTSPAFRSNDDLTKDQVKEWLAGRRRLVIDDVNAKICPHRVSYLVHRGYLDSVSELIVFDCHAHRAIIALLARLPNIELLVLADQDHSDEEQVLDDLEAILTCVGEMHSLKQLDISFDCTISGSRLSFLTNFHSLEKLKLRGFDLSDGVTYVRGLKVLTSLHLCHGNYHSSPSNDVDENDLLNLMDLTNLKQVHLEGFNFLTDIGLTPFCTSSSNVEGLTLKHCQHLCDDCLPSIGRMGHLKSLHLVHTAYDDAPLLSAESLQHLNALSSLRTLSLFYVLGDLSDLKVLWDLTSLETLNIALEDGIDLEDLNYLCHSILPAFVSLRKLRIFSEDCTNYTCHGIVEVEFAKFNFGMSVNLE